MNSQSRSRYNLVNTESASSEHIVHVRYDGQSYDIPFSQLFPADRFEQLGIPAGTEVTAFNVGTGVVRAALANHFDRSVDEFADYVIEPHENGNMTLRPKAVFGSFLEIEFGNDDEEEIMRKKIRMDSSSY